jgi:hypothetical protein
VGQAGARARRRRGDDGSHRPGATYVRGPGRAGDNKGNPGAQAGPHTLWPLPPPCSCCRSRQNAASAPAWAGRRAPLRSAPSSPPRPPATANRLPPPARLACLPAPSDPSTSRPVPSLVGDFDLVRRRSRENLLMRDAGNGSRTVGTAPCRSAAWRDVDVLRPAGGPARTCRHGPTAGACVVCYCWASLLSCFVFGQHIETLVPNTIQTKGV